jgi:hypothetical protein
MICENAICRHKKLQILKILMPIWFHHRCM